MHRIINSQNKERPKKSYKRATEVKIKKKKMIQRDKGRFHKERGTTLLDRRGIFVVWRSRRRDRKIALTPHNST